MRREVKVPCTVTVRTVLEIPRVEHLFKLAQRARLSKCPSHVPLEVDKEFARPEEELALKTKSTAIARKC